MPRSSGALARSLVGRRSRCANRPITSKWTISSDNWWGDSHVALSRSVARSYGAFARKLRWLAIDDSVITLPFAIRGMTGLAAGFLGLPDRGLVKVGFAADLVVFDLATLRDKATYESPHQLSEGMVHVLVNGRFALRDRRPTGVLAGAPLLRGGQPFRARSTR